MSQEQIEQSGGSAAQWLRSNPTVSANALLSLGIDPTDLPICVAEEPEILMDLTEAVISESEKQHAPAPVIDEMRSHLQSMDRSHSRKALIYAREKFRELKDLPHADAAVAFLSRAAASAPDAQNRQKLEQMLAAVEQHINRQPPGSGVEVNLRPQDGAACLFCCAVGFAELGVGCLIGCAGCLLLSVLTT
jgi:hypothetical protein